MLNICCKLWIMTVHFRTHLAAVGRNINYESRFFSAVAVFIACLGLFGLATFSTLQRIKEIGIRKVLGASVPNILALLSREIIMLIVVASIIAWPIAWLVMRRWLGTFAYHIDMSMLVYALTAIGALVVALLTVSVQTLRAALANPSSTLHNE